MPGLFAMDLEEEIEDHGEEVPKKIETAVKMKPITSFFKSPKALQTQKTLQKSHHKSISNTSDGEPRSNGHGGRDRSPCNESGSQKVKHAKLSSKRSKNLPTGNSSKKVNLDDSSEDFEYSHKQNKPQKNIKSGQQIKTNVHVSNGVSQGQHDTQESSPTETISYTDFLLSAGVDENTNASDSINLITPEREENTEVMEVSYEDFLKAEEGHCESEVPGQQVKEITPSENSDMVVTESGSENVKCEELEQNKEKRPKALSITNFFAKVEKQPTKCQPKPEFTHLTVKADVHPCPDNNNEPMKQSKMFSFNDNGSLSIVGVKNSRSNVVVCDQDIDMSITQLETIDISPPRKRKVGPDKASVDNSINTKTPDDENNDDVIIHKVESAHKSHDEEVLEKERRKMLSEQLANLDKIPSQAKGKTTQATLNFGGGKLIAVKPVKPVDSQPDRDSTEKDETAVKNELVACEPSEHSTPNKRRRNRQVIRDESEEEEDQTKKKTQRKATKNIKGKTQDTHKKQSTSDETEDGTDPDNSYERQGKRRTTPMNIYSASMIPGKKKGKQKTPIRMRFTKVKNLTTLCSNDDPDLTPRSIRSKPCVPNKVSKAQELLMKAKQKKGASVKTKAASKKTKPKTNTKKKAEKPVGKKKKPEGCGTSCSAGGESPPIRRSSRSCAATAKIAIAECVDSDKLRRNKQSCDEEHEIINLSDSDSTSTMPSKSKKTSKTSSKTPTKTPKKTQGQKEKKGKLAPIFRKKKGVNDGIITVSDDSGEDIVVVPTVDPEVLKIRRDFLMSGVPEAMKKQKAVTAASAQQLAEYPPFPQHSHVQQAGDLCEQSGLNPWNLRQVTLPLRKTDIEDNFVSPQSNKLLLGNVTCCKEKVTGCKVDQNRVLPNFTKEVVKFLLGEINLHNPAYPVRRVYKQLLVKKQQVEGFSEKSTDPGSQVKPTINVPGSKKRKIEDDDGQHSSGQRNKRRREEGNEDGSSRGNRLRRRSSRRSLELGPKPEEQKPEKEETKKTETKTSENNATAQGEVQWTEKYQPLNSGEILGNSSGVKKLKSWLVDWKHRTDVELRRMKKQLLKEARRTGKSKEEVKKKLGSDWWSDDDSDFELGSSEEESEDQTDGETSLRNTMLLVGPHGVGKTAIVYALAKELGYKVFEVNASSRRNGKHLLAQLQEATKSHQVALTGLDAMYTTFMATADATLSQTGVCCDKPAPKKMPTAFTNFFKKGTASAKTEQPKGRKSTSPKKKMNASKKKTKKEDEDITITRHETPKKRQMTLFGKQSTQITSSPIIGTSGEGKKGLQLSSTSLILFEEVDVVFEEDKGFWAAIQTFINTTKRPIILTSSSGKVNCLLEGQHDEIKLRHTLSANIASHLQVLCLVENLRTSYYDLLTLVEVMGGDLRKLILALQYWVKSGGGLVLNDKEPIKYLAKFFEKKEEGGSCLTPTTDVPQQKQVHTSSLHSAEFARDSGDEFEVSLSHVRRRRRVPVIEDDSSQESFPGTPRKPLLLSSGWRGLADESSQSGSECFLQGDAEKKAGKVDVATGITPPPVHLLCHNSVMCTSDMHEKNSDVLNSIGRTADVSAAMRMVGSYHNQQVELVYGNLPHLLDLPTLEAAIPRRPPCLPPSLKPEAPPQRRRILNANDLFDSEEDSNSGFVTLNKNKSCENASLPETKQETIQPIRQHQKWTPNDTLMKDSVHALSDLYDVFSFTDAHLQQEHLGQSDACGRNSEFEWYLQGSLCPGLTDQKRLVEIPHWWSKQRLAEVTSFVQIKALQKTNCCLKSVLSCVDQLDSSKHKEVRKQLSIPVEEDVRRVRVTQERGQQLSLGVCYRKAAADVSSCLPSNTQRSAINLDYLPILRIICKGEQCRKEAKVKRRFFHYMDQINLPLKTSTKDTLCTSFS